MTQVIRARIVTISVDEAGSYSYDWTPDTTGTYQIQAVCPSDEQHTDAVRTPITLTVNTAHV